VSSPDDGPRSDPPPGQPGPAPQGGPYGPTPYDDPGSLPHVYNPYGNFTYPTSYPTPPAGLGPDDTVPPARRPGTVTLGLVLAVVSALPYLLVGFLAVTAAGEVEAGVPPEQLAQLQQPGLLAGGRRQPQLAARVGQHDPGRGRGQEGDAAVGEQVQEVDDVEVGDHRVGQLYEGVGEQLGVHLGHLSSLAGRLAVAPPGKRC